MPQRASQGAVVFDLQRDRHRDALGQSGSAVGVEHHQDGLANVAANSLHPPTGLACWLSSVYSSAPGAVICRGGASALPNHYIPRDPREYR